MTGIRQRKEQWERETEKAIADWLRKLGSTHWASDSATPHDRAYVALADRIERGEYKGQS